MLERAGQILAMQGSVEERLRRAIAGWVDAVANDPYAPRLIVEQVLFGDEADIDAFVERFGRPNAEALIGLLEAGRASGEIRPVEPMFLLPAMIGMCVFYFLSAPIHQRLFGIERITPELAHRFADHTASLVMHGVAAGGGGAP
jgi:AcrR family transcriptional regulator